MGTSNESERLLVPAPRAANILAISERSLYRLVARGDLEQVRLSDRIVRYRVADLRAMAAPRPAAWPPRMADGQATPPTPPAPRRQRGKQAPGGNGARPHRVASGRGAR